MMEEDAECRVVLPSGEPIALVPAAGQPGESALALRLRIGASLRVDPECVVLVAGVKVLEGTWLVSDVLQEFGGGDLTVLIAENYMDASDPQHVAEYASEIYRKLVKEDSAGKLATSAPEALMRATPGCCAPAGSSAPETSLDSSSDMVMPTSLHTLDLELELQTPPKRSRGEQVDQTCRCALMDWLVEEHHKLQLRMETLFLAGQLVDRFLLRRRVASKDLRLVGAAGLLIASKFEDIFPPEIRDLVCITNQEYTVDDIKLMEVIMLSVLQFSIAGQTAAHFMERYGRASRCNEVECRLVRYILELALVDKLSVQYSPSHLASAAVLQVNRFSGRLPVWPAAMVNYSGQTEEVLQPCVRELQKLVREARHSRFQGVCGKLTKDAPLLELVRTIEAAVA